ncbi:MAG: hypothetical protein KDD33_10020, partial [Bdellovibrionales bacterium]|nr:hypothetical protein [Bdellovibrionales bacterium]
GGWALESNIGSDQLYTASYSLQNGVPSVSNQLTPLKWNNAGYSAGQIPGFHVNDASVIKAPGQNWQFMYYTLLDNQFATEASMTKKNWVGFASSTDGGATWFNHGPIIKQNNGVNMTGAWAPSALVESDHIRLYYHTGDKSCLSDNDPCTHPAVAQPPRVHMSRMANNGWQRLSSHQITDMSGHPLILTNVDVVKNGSKYYLTGNTPDLLKIELYESSNGIQFKAVGSSSTLISTSQSHWITTPHLRVLDKNILEVAFSYHTPTSYGFPMAKSSHTWKVLLP